MLVPRMLVRFFLCCCNCGRYSIMPISRGFGSTNENHHTVLLIVRGYCDIENIRKHILQMLDSSNPRTDKKKFLQLKKRVLKRFGYLCLEDCSSSFNIKNHVKYFNTQKKDEVVSLDEVMSFLETSYYYEESIQSSTNSPQWELLAIPKFAYSKEQAELLGSPDKNQFYCLIFRFNHGIMNWNMFQQLFIEFHGKTVQSTFGLPLKPQCCTCLVVPFVGPRAFLGQLCKKWKRFGGVDTPIPRTSLATSKTFDVTAFEDVKSMSFTSMYSVLATCVRIAARNLVCGQDVELPKTVRVARVFNTKTSKMQGVDFFSIKFRRFRNALERLQGTFHTLERQQGACTLAAQRMFNKVIMLVAGTCCYSLSAWFYKIMLKADMIIENWPLANEPCTIFGNDLIADVIGWAGIAGVDSDMKVTVTTYCGRVRANFTGKRGFFGSLTDAKILANEFGEELRNLADGAGLYRNLLCLSPAVDNN